MNFSIFHWLCTFIILRWRYIVFKTISQSIKYNRKEWWHGRNQTIGNSQTPCGIKSSVLFPWWGDMECCQPWYRRRIIHCGFGSAYGVYSQNSYTHLQFIGIQHFYDFALCDFHLISCAACDKRKKDLSNLGPLYHFLYDSRYVYANAAVMRKRNHRLGHVGCGMGRVRHWYLIKRSGHEAL